MKTKISLILICFGLFFGISHSIFAATSDYQTCLSSGGDATGCAGMNGDPNANSSTTGTGGNSAFNYTPMEKIPGFENQTNGDFYTYIALVYKFGIWAVGIAALLMISIGGFMYVTSAGNNSSMEKAKGVITDAIIGLILALTSYLLLYIINPDLVRIVPLPNLGQGGTNGTTNNGGSGSQGSGSGACTQVSTGPCSVANLTSTFGSNAEKASSICNAESGGKEGLGSGVDKCQPGGEIVSWGLFQFNITANASKFPGCSGNGGLSNVYTGSNKNCTITNRSLYDTCVAAAKDPANNIAAAYKLSNGGTRWSAWGANSKCKF